MGKRLLVLSTLLILLVGDAASVAVTSAQEAEQPLKKSRVGDYVIFKLSGAQVKGMMRQEVIAVTDKEVTIRSTSTINGLTQKPSEQTVPITKQHDPAQEAKNRKNVKFVDTGKGQETLTIQGKEYRCAWRSNTTTISAGDTEITSASKVWISSDAPIYGLVKTETKTFGQVTVMELTESGSTK